MAETVLIRAALPAPKLVEAFMDAVARDADVDLVVEGWVSRLLPEAARRLAQGGRDALAAMAMAPLFPKVFAILIEARKMGRTWTCRRVAGLSEVVVEIRKDPTFKSRER